MTATRVVQPDVYFTMELAGHDELDDGSVIVHGIPCNPGTLDVDGQGANAAWLKTALTRWHQTGSNIREMHQPSAVGVGKTLEWDGDVPHITAHVVDPVAAKKVKAKVYKSFSIGVKKPVLNKRHPVFKNGEIVGGDIIETSLVDRPAIPGSDILDFKGDLFKIAATVSEDEVLDYQVGIVYKLAATVFDLEKADTAPLEPVWDAADSAEATKQLISDALNGATTSGPFASSPRFWVMDVNAECALVQDWSAPSGTAAGGCAWVVPYSRNVDGTVSLAPSSDWTRAEQEWVEARKAAIADKREDLEKAMSTNKETKVADIEPTEKSAEVDAEKTVDEATDKAADADETKADAEKSPVIAEYERRAEHSAFCPDCQKSVEIVDGKNATIAGNVFLVGKDAEGHELKKFVSAEVAKADADETKADDAEKGAEAEAEKSVETPVDKGADADTKKAEDDETDECDKDAEKAEKTPVAADASTQDLVKAALADLLADAGIDLGKIGRKMRKSRLDRLTASIDELKGLAIELSESPDVEKGAQSGTDAATRMQAVIAEITSLAGQMASPGEATQGAEGDEDDMGRSTLATPRDQSIVRSADADITKHDSTVQQDAAEELAKSVAATLEKAVLPLVERLEKVEYSVKPASDPVLTVQERSNAFVGKQAEGQKIAEREMLEKLGELSDDERLKLVAGVLGSTAGWPMAGQ